MPFFSELFVYYAYRRNFITNGWLGLVVRVY